MGYGPATCRICGRMTIAYPEVGEDESWVVCTCCGGEVRLDYGYADICEEESEE